MANLNKELEIQRPGWITWSCIVLYVAGLLNIIISFTGIYAPYGILYSGLNVLLIVFMFAALSGIWSMEKWGVVLFAIVLLLKLAVDVFYRAFQYWELVLLVPVVLFLLLIKKMK